MTGRKYDVRLQNGDFSRERKMCIVYIVYKIPLTSVDEPKLRMFTAMEIVTPQMLENICKVTEYRLDILRAKKCAHVEVV
jgi:hypothetical protein